jgi:DNA-directed RNA polymerase subunit RPC12/RpoP
VFARSPTDVPPANAEVRSPVRKQRGRASAWSRHEQSARSRFTPSQRRATRRTCDKTRTPNDVTVERVLRPDRRVHRAPTPACDHCGSTENVSAIRRAPHAVVFRCRECGRVRLVPVANRVPCPQCGSKYILRLRTRWWQRPWRWLSGRVPIQCHVCAWRGWDQHSESRQTPR